MRIAVVCVVLVLLVGCAQTAKRITVPLDSAPLSGEMATVVLYFPATLKQGPLTQFSIEIDGEAAGPLIAEQPLRVALTPGVHRLEGKLTGVATRPATVHLAAGQVYYYKVWRDYGTFVDTVEIVSTPPASSYSIISHRP